MSSLTRQRSLIIVARLAAVRTSLGGERRASARQSRADAGPVGLRTRYSHSVNAIAPWLSVNWNIYINLYRILDLFVLFI